MQLEKLKLKSNDVSVFEVEGSTKEKIAMMFNIDDKKDQIITDIIYREKLTKINNYIETLDFDKDFMMWIFYPKETSKKYKGKVEVKRYDIRMGINDKVKKEAMVSLDDDWSAIRLRNKNFSK